MSSETLLNSTNNKTLINTGSSSEVDSLTGIVVLGRYTLLNRINTPSGEAALYMAVCTPSPNSSVQNTPVVVKIYRRKDAVKPEVLSKLAKLKSPGIVEIIDHGFYNGFACIVMPYYMNGSLAGKTLSYEVIKDIVIPEVTEGLKYLHENGIIHKDIKPANLMISNDGKHINIIDFGISSAKDDGVSILITRTGMSPEYCAPETFNNVWVEESDFYSLGITLFELFKGHTPFNYSSDKQTLAASASIQKIQFSLDFPAELINLIKGLTYKDLSNRKDLNNPNRRWTWREIEKWQKGEKIAIPGEITLDRNIKDSTDKSVIRDYNFRGPYDFKTDKGNIINLSNLSEFVETFGSNWKEGKKHVGRGLVSKFFLQQDMRSISNIVMDCEDAGTTDFAYSKLLVELSSVEGKPVFYWHSTKIKEMKLLSEMLISELSRKSKNICTEYENIVQALCYWYEATGNANNQKLINTFHRKATVEELNIETKIIALCSFIYPDIPITIGSTKYQNISILTQFIEKLKKGNEEKYYDWLEDNRKNFEPYTKCSPDIQNIFNKLINDFQTFTARKKKEERARREREEQIRKEREEQARREREEQTRREREEQARREREEQARREKEKLLRREKEEKARRERELLAQEERKQKLAITYLLVGLVLVALCIIFLTKKYEQYVYSVENPVLNSPNEITDELVQRIIDNSLKTLTINYEFTQNIHKNNENLDRNDNPFYRANQIKPLEKVEFSVEFGQNVKSLASAFEDFDELKYVNIKDTSNIEDMSFMFSGAQLFNQPIGNWNTSKVKDMSHMFSDALLFNQPIGNWNTSNVENMEYMFSNAPLFNQPIGSWNTSKVKNMSNMFSYAHFFNQPVDTWDISMVRDMSYMFSYASSFNQSVNKWDLLNVKNTNDMFTGAESFDKKSFIEGQEKWKNPILNSLDDITNELLQRIIDNNLTSITINYEFTDSNHSIRDRLLNNPFFKANSIKPIKRMEFKIIFGSRVHSLAGAFKDFYELEYINIADTSNITDMSNMFERASTFNQPIDHWDTSKVTNMSSIFSEATSFNQPIGKWNTSNVTNMSSMFSEATSFNQPIGKWNTSNVTTMSSMFSKAASFNQPIDKWNTSSVTSMFNMFGNAKSFNQSIKNWNISKVTNMNYMFSGATSFQQPIGNWDLSNVATYMMFDDSYKYKKQNKNSNSTRPNRNKHYYRR